MPWNGTGQYVLPPAYTPEVNGTVIDAVRYNGTTNDIASGISFSLAKNGQNVPTANLPMGGFRHTGVAAAVSATDYTRYDQFLKGYTKNTAEYYGAVSDGSTPADVAIQQAIDYVSSEGGGFVWLVEPGVYLLDASLNRPANVTIAGMGYGATELKCSGNFPAIQAVGTIVSVINNGGVRDLTIRGSGKANSNAIGIKEVFTNRSELVNVYFKACRYGAFFSNVWQVKLDNLQANGAGADQNYIGVYMAEVDPANQNNAVNAINCTMQGVEKYGWRLINFNGSKFTNCEGLDGEHGFYLGDPTTGSEAIRWGHFVNCLADTNSSHNWRLEKGAATSFQQVAFSNCWAGNTGDNNWRVAGCSELSFSAPMCVQASSRSFYFELSSRCTISGGQLIEFNQIDSGQAGIWIQESQYIVVTGNHIYSSVASSKAVVEFGGSTDYNSVIGNTLQGDVTKVGANSKFRFNVGSAGEKSGSAVIAAANTSVTVTHGMAYTPSINDVRLTPRDSMGVNTKYWASNMTATTFVINYAVAPGSDSIIAWAIDPLGQ